MVRIKLIISAFLLVFSSAIYAITTDVDGDWNVGTNWVADAVPGVGDYARIVNVITVSSVTTIGSLDIDIGGSLTINSGTTLTVTGALGDLGAGAIIVNGTLNVNSLYFDNVLSITVGPLGVINVTGNFSLIDGALNNDGLIDVGGTGLFDNQPALDNDGTLDFAGLLTISTDGTGALENTNGTINARASLNLSSSNISNCITNGDVNYWGTLTEGVCTISGSGVALPVELVQFYGSQIQDAILVEWSTASEKNNDAFILEHSINGESFSFVADVLGSGTSSLLHVYSFEHLNPMSGSNYYRLNQIDIDGTSVTSDVISVYFDLEPNLTHQTIIKRGMRYDFETNNGNQYAVLTSTSGVYKIINVDNGFLSINTSDLVSGTYFISIGETQITFMIVD